MLYATKMVPAKKFGLGLMFCGGIFTTVAGLLRCILILTSGVSGPQQAGEWSCRESFLAVFISNIPFIVPVINGMHSRLTTRGSDGKYESHTLRTFGSSKKGKRFNHPLSIPQDTVMDRTVYERYGSNEMIVGPDGGDRATSTKSGDTLDNGLGGKGDSIQITTEWDVESRQEKDSKQGDIGRANSTSIFTRS